MKLLFICFMILQSAYAFESKHYYEVTADKVGNLAFMTGTGSTPNFYSGETDVSCGYLLDGQEINFRQAGYAIGGNPVIINNDKKVFLVCMSANLDYSAGSLDLAVYDIETKTLGPWKNVVKTYGAIPDKPSFAINDNNVIVMSYIDVREANGIKASLKILKSDDLGNNWLWTTLPKTSSNIDQMIQGEQGNYTWSDGSKFYTSYSFYEKSVIEVISSQDNANTFSLFLKFEHSIPNVEMFPPITKPVLSADGDLKALLLYFGHSFKSALMFPYVNTEIGPPLLLSDSSTMVDAKFLSNRFWVLETKNKDNEVKTYFKEYDSNLDLINATQVSKASKFDESAYYYGAYQVIQYRNEVFTLNFIDYLDDLQVLKKLEFVLNSNY